QPSRSPPRMPRRAPPRHSVRVGCGYFATPGGEPCADSRPGGMNCKAALAARLPPQIALFGDQDLALAGMVGLADDALVLHALHQRGGAVVADLETALDVGRGGLAVALHDGDGLRVEIAAFGHSHSRRIEHRAVLAFGLVLGRDLLEVVRHALRL